MMKVAARIKALKAELGKIGIKDAQVTSLPALPAKKIEALEKKHKSRLPDEIRAYYLETNGQTIFWSTADGVAVARSRILNVQAFLESCSSNEASETSVPYHSRYLGEAEKRTLDGYWVFERIYADSFILVPVNAKSGAVPVFLLQFPSRLTMLDLSFSAYLEQLFENKALLNWQESHKDQDKDPDLIASFEKASMRLAALTNPALVAKSPAPSKYRKRLNDLVNMVKSNRRLDLVRLETYPEPPVNVFKKIEATFGRKLPDSMNDFYSQVNGFKMLWRTTSDGPLAAAGSIDILPLEQAFGGDHHESMLDWDDQVTYQTLWTNEIKEAAQEDFRALKNKRVFDRHLGRNQVLMEVTDEGVKFFYYIDGGVTKLSTTFEDLIDLVFSCGGLEYYPDLLRLGVPDEQFVRDFSEKARCLNPLFHAPCRRLR